ncbi:MAG TPA: hypothetical protein VG796_12260 [Verrucomicrobiales bacterium]|jgi:hypothetical protein|nr:hypothetical protein [Verrucomicrobiales bacterium]
MNEEPPDSSSTENPLSKLKERWRRFSARDDTDEVEVESEGPRMGRQQAALDGCQAAVLRVTLGIAIIVGSIVFGVVSAGLREYLHEWEILPKHTIIPSAKLPELVRLGLCPLAWVAAAVITIVVTASDEDRKWRQLNWVICVLFASAALIPRVPWPYPVAIAAGLLGLHGAIHFALKGSDHARRWQDEMERQEREALKEAEELPAKPSLLKRYSGVAGFDDEDPNRERNSSNEGPAA